MRLAQPANRRTGTQPHRLRPRQLTRINHLELGYDHTRHQICHAILRACQLGRLDVDTFELVLGQRRGHPGAARVRAALALHAAGSAGTRGRGEDRLLAGVLGSRILPEPDVCNRTTFGIGGIEPDLAWPDARLRVELDGGPHGWADLQVRDAQQDALVASHGWLSLHFASLRIWNDLPAVVAEIERAWSARM